MWVPARHISQLLPCRLTCKRCNTGFFSDDLHFFSPQLTKTLLIVCAVVVLAPFPYVLARPTQVQGKRCVPTKSLQINDSTSRIRINYQIFKVASKTPSYVQIVQLFCKTGYFLALNVTAKKNRIIGIVNKSSESSKSLIILSSSPSPWRGCNIIVVILFQAWHLK